MTSDLEKIAEEIDRDDSSIGNLGPTARLHDWAARIRAWIAANKESPQSPELSHDEAVAALNHAIFLMQQKYHTGEQSYDRNLEKWIPMLGQMSALWTPQRKAFVEAAIAEKAHSLDAPYGEDGQVAWAKKQGDLEIFAMAAYRAMIEAEKVEPVRLEDGPVRHYRDGERGEGT